MASLRYRELIRAVSKTRKSLLPSKFDPTGSYRNPAKVHLRAISFRIIAHAEIESFLEDRAKELLDLAWNRWQSSRVSSEVIVGLMAYSGVETVLPPEKLGVRNSAKSYQDMNDALQKSLNVWMSNYKGNHGIKENNVLMLLLPLGIRHTLFDTTLLADLSSFGSSRGEVAHRSNFKTASYADPKSEYDRVEKLANDLSKIDDLINDAIRKIKRSR